MAKDNKTIGRFHLGDIPPAMRGTPQIEVTFDIDSNGIIHVSAKDKGTGKEQTIRIEASSGLSKEEIEKMRAEAKANEEADKKSREKAEKINIADSLAFQTEKQMKEFGDKISADKKTAIENALAELKNALTLQDVEQIDKASEALNTAWNAASEEIYKASQEAANANAGAQPNNGAPHTEQKPGDTVSDVEYEEVKDNK
jgi:molecular chaperone DnaK